MKNLPYSQEINDVLEFFNTNAANGLTNEEAIIRLQTYGQNKLSKVTRPSLIKLFFKQFNSSLIFVLLFALLIVLFLGYVVDSIIIFVILFFNAFISTIHEKKAYSIVDSLQEFFPTECTVLRGSKKILVDKTQIVPGDIIFLNQGDQVPADSRLIESYGLKVDESILTGESNPVTKDIKKLNKNLTIFEQSNMIFNGTYIVSGNAKALVTATGDFTEIGKIQKQVQRIEVESPLQKQLKKLSDLIIKISLCICLFILIYGYFILNKTIAELLLLISAFFVAIIPEGLPLILTLVLANGAYIMAKKFVLCKNLPAAEGLSRVNIIVMDKTGTLTKNEMMVEKVFIEPNEYHVTGLGYSKEGQIINENSEINNAYDQELLLAATFSILIDNSIINYNLKSQTYFVKGEPMEAAMGIFAQKLKIDQTKILSDYKKIFEMPFDYLTRVRWYVWQRDKKIIFITSGSPDSVVNYCTGDLTNINTKISQYLDLGYRVVALAYKEIEDQKIINYENFINQNLLGNLNFLALFAIKDTLRHDVKSSIETANDYGIEVIIATGDHKKTAQFIANESGILKTNDLILTGKEIRDLSDSQLIEQIKNIRVFARMTPEDKLRIINLLKSTDNLVAMVGDGVNDAPAIMAADLGIAMGLKGASVTTQAADMILLDDSFVSLVKAIEVGRHIFYTMHRLILYLFATNFAEIIIIIASLVIPGLLPLLPIQILWLNVVTDSFLDISLSAEKPEQSILKYKLFQKRRLFDKFLLLKILYLSSIMAIGTILLYLYIKNSFTIEKTRTMILQVLVSFQWFNALNCRSENQSIFKLGLFSNIWLVSALIFVLILQSTIIYIPFLQQIFKTVPLQLKDWLLAFSVASSIFIIEEIRKYIWHKLSKNNGL